MVALKQLVGRMQSHHLTFKLSFNGRTVLSFRKEFFIFHLYLHIQAAVGDFFQLFHFTRVLWFINSSSTFLSFLYFIIIIFYLILLFNVQCRQDEIVTNRLMNQFLFYPSTNIMDKQEKNEKNTGFMLNFLLFFCVLNFFILLRHNSFNCFIIVMTIY